MNSTIQKLGAIFGVVFILAAIAGLIAPGGMAMQPTDPTTAAKALGIFPVNLLHNVVHLAFGIWALVASRSWGGSKQFFVVGGYIYIVLTVLGFIAPTGFGLVPLGGTDIGLHALLGVVMLAIGYISKPVAATTTA
ncbi:MAG: hypothetical protein NVSMB53_02190 [Gemmatimonadaceae bacterium]